MLVAALFTYVYIVARQHAVCLDIYHVTEAHTRFSFVIRLLHAIFIKSHVSHMLSVAAPMIS